MESVPVNPNPPAAASEPELNFLLSNTSLEESIFTSLVRQIDEFFFPKKLPPLKLESKPEPVKEIWGFYSNWKAGAAGAAGYYALLAGLMVLVAVIGQRVVAAPKESVKITLISPDDAPLLKPSKTQAGGGGGGGDRDVLNASRGKLPKTSLQQLAPPVVVVRNEHPKLAVEPTVIVPPQIQMATVNMPNLGDPLAHAVVPSNGTGSGGGIGSGSGGGVGSGHGAGVGPGEGGGYGGGLYHVGGGVSPPRLTYQAEPEFSEEARKAKFQGIVTLSLIVGIDGRPSDIHVVGSLGMGLDEKAIEAVKNWRFDPALKDGHPVRVPIQVEVDFHLY